MMMMSNIIKVSKILRVPVLILSLTPLVIRCEYCLRSFECGHRQNMCDGALWVYSLLTFQSNPWARNFLPISGYQGINICAALRQLVRVPQNNSLRMCFCGTRKSRCQIIWNLLHNASHHWALYGDSFKTSFYWLIAVRVVINNDSSLSYICIASFKADINESRLYLNILLSFFLLRSFLVGILVKLWLNMC